MSIEQKIAEILAESKIKTADAAVEIVSEEEELVASDDSEESEEIVEISDVEDAIEEETILDIKDDINALTEGEDLTEEFKQKAAIIFEAAVMNRVKQEVAKLDEANQIALDEQVEQIKEGLVEKVDGYLDYIVEQWITQNEIALERGMKSEILEGFVSGLKSLFEQSYIDIPEEKFDVLGTLEEEVDGLNAKLDEQLAANVELNKELATYQVSKITADLSEGLVETDKEKFHALVEELEFNGVESFQKKAQTIRESYFTNKVTTKTVVESVVTDAPITLTEEKIYTPQIRGYMAALDNLK